MTTTLTDRPSSPATAAPGGSPRRERMALAVLLAGTAVLHLWDLSRNGWGNDFYAGAVQAMTKNWTAFFFGSSDAGNTVTVDKPPAALWVQAISAKIFGLSSWSVLAPQALMAVATVALLYAAVKRVAGPGAGLVAGTAMALTPVAVLMFRFDNPDAMLVLVMAAAAYAVVRAQERASTRWLLLAGALMGLAFLTKTAQSFLVLPGLALAYLWAAPTGGWRRVRQLLAAGVALVVAAGWWFLVAALWPASSRPYIGGSTDNSALQLAFGYNGLGRILGQGFGRTGGDAFPGGAAPSEMPGGFPGGGGGPFGGSAGIGRMFATDVGGQVAWLLPAALVLLVTGLLLTRRAARTDRLRASLLLWGGWTVVSALVFSLMEGIFHQYYTVALAPGIAALVGIGGAQLRERRDARWARLVLAAVVLGTVAWAWVLLDRTPEFVPWLKWVVVALGIVGAALLALPARAVAVGGLAASLVGAGLGPAAYAAQTVGTSHNGGIVLAGPATPGGFGGGRGRDGAGDANRRNTGATGGTAAGGAAGGTAASGTTGGTAAGDAAGGNAAGGTATGGTTAGGTSAGGTAAGTTAGGTAGGTTAGTASGGSAAGEPPAGGAPAGGAGPGFGGGGPGERGVVDQALVDLLRGAGTTWSAATVGASSAAPLALASGTDVMGIGGFMGSDPAPTLAAFQADVAASKIHYFVVGGGPGGGMSPAQLPADVRDNPAVEQALRGGFGRSEISTWVEQHFTKQTVGGRTVYDLTKPVTAG